MKRIFSGRNGRFREDRASVWRLVLALVLLHGVLLLPIWPGSIRPDSFLFFPLELPALVVLFALPLGRAGIWLRRFLVAVLTILLMLKIANITTYLFFARGFNPVVDPFLVPIAIETLAKTNTGLIAGLAVGTLVLVAFIAGVFVWTGRVFAARRAASLVIGALLALVGGAMWIAPQIVPAHVKLRDPTTFYAVRFATSQVTNVERSLAASAQFKRDAAADPFRDFPQERLLTRLNGKDVLLIFVEAYGAAALDDADGAPAQLLTSWQDRLTHAGYGMRSAWLTSPTFGGGSWLAHGTFVAGLWIDDHQRYNTLFISDRKTLIGDFKSAGWRTAAVMPLFTRAWPEGQFFGYDVIYDAHNLGYAGPSFGYVTMPDQYTLSAFHQREMTALPRVPVMAEIALGSSHLPWTPRAHIVPWEQVGDGSIFATAREGSEADIDWRDFDKMREHYTKAITYAMESVFSYAATQVSSPALIIILGDHQPIPIVSGNDATHNVPIHILSRDPADLAAFAGWTSGLTPDAQSPVWKMDAMRAHILNAYSGDEPQRGVAPEGALPVSSEDPPPDGLPLEGWSPQASPPHTMVP